MHPEKEESTFALNVAAPLRKTERESMDIVRNAMQNTLKIAVK